LLLYTCFCLLWRENIDMYIFLDESGDLGFDFTKVKTSKYFVITCLFTEDKRQIEKVVKKTHSELTKVIKRKVGTLHSVTESVKTRKRLLARLAATECKIMTICLDKKKVYSKLHDEKQVLYNYVVNILLDRIYTKKLVPIDKVVFLIASKRETNKFLNSNFKDYLENQVKNTHKTKLEISIKTPHEEKGLQAVDFASWAIFRKYEKGDASYYELLKSNIVEENSLFK